MTKLTALYATKVGTNLHKHYHDHTKNKTKRDHNL